MGFLILFLIFTEVNLKVLKKAMSSLIANPIWNSLPKFLCLTDMLQQIPTKFLLSQQKFDWKGQRGQPVDLICQ